MNIIPLLQQLLALLGFTVPAAELDNGEPGPGTRDAIAAFQALLELERTGEPNDETVRAIMTLAAQHLLTLAGLDIDDDEQWRARQSDSTTLALRQYQAARALEVTGQLDEHTLRDLQERAGNPNFLVSGKVSDGQGQGTTACVVTAADLDRNTGALAAAGRTRPAQCRQPVPDRVHGEADSRAGQAARGPGDHGAGGRWRLAGRAWADRSAARARDAGPRPPGSRGATAASRAGHPMGGARHGDRRRRTRERRDRARLRPGPEPRPAALGRGNDDRPGRRLPDRVRCGPVPRGRGGARPAQARARPPVQGHARR